MAYRSSFQETTKLSPSLLILGREVELPIDIIYDTHSHHSEFPVETKATNDYVDKLQNPQKCGKYMQKLRVTFSKLVVTRNDNIM